MARAKNLINKLVSECKDIYFREKEEARTDWENQEMACVTIAIFGGGFYDYLREIYKKPVLEGIYKFQKEIYDWHMEGKMSMKEYEYAYQKSKDMLDCSFLDAIDPSLHSM